MILEATSNNPIFAVSLPLIKGEQIVVKMCKSVFELIPLNTNRPIERQRGLRFNKINTGPRQPAMARMTQS